MKVGYILMAIGLILVGMSLIYTTGLDASAGIIENLHAEGQMYIVLKEGEYFDNERRKVYKDPDFVPENSSNERGGQSVLARDEHGYYEIQRFTGYEGRVTIPTKYPYWASIILIIIGLAKVAIAFASQKQ